MEKSISEEVTKMLSSTRVFKATNIVGEQTSAKIETYVKEEIQEELMNDETVGAREYRNAQKKAQALLSEAEREKQQLIEQAQVEMAELKQNTYEEAFQSGSETGYQEGFQQGYADAKQQAELENNQEKEKIQLMLEEALAEIDNYKFEKKSELIELASHMAEKIVHKELDASERGILDLAEPYFYQLDKHEELVSITVHSSQRERAEKQLPEIARISPNTRFVIYGDPKLEEKGIIIESSKVTIDLQIKKQIEAMLKEFDEMERTVDA